jgi:hypothetical protein
MVALKRAVGYSMRAVIGYIYSQFYLSSFSTDSSCKLDILWHDGDSLSVDCAKIGILEETDEISLARLLQGHHRRALESEVRLEVLGNLPHQSLERQLPDQQLRTLLVTTDLSESHCSRSVTMGLLHTSGRRGTLSSSLRCQLLPRGFPSSRLTGRLLCSSHFFGCCLLEFFR